MENIFGYRQHNKCFERSYFLTILSESLVYRINNRGPNIEPCGTPISNKHVDDFDLCTETVNDLSDRLGKT